MLLRLLPVLCLLLTASMFGFPSPVQADTQITREDGAVVHIAVEGVDDPACQGVVVISHGAGGTEADLKYLVQASSQAHWLSVRIRHEESGPDALRSRVMAKGLQAGLVSLITDRRAYLARLMDVHAALEWAQTHCHQPKRMLIGHSMGAVTAMLEAGALNYLSVSGRNQFDAYVVMSPQGPGNIFPGNAWRKLQKPFLILTGTRDDALNGSWESRTLPYEGMPSGCKWLGVLDGATHLNFAGKGLAGKTERLTVQVVQAFLDNLAKGRCDPMPVLAGMQYQHK